MPARRRRRWRRVLMLLGPIVVLGVGGYFYVTGGRWVSTDNAYVHADMGMVSAEVSGPITEVAVRENQHVTKGEVLFRIDDRPYRIALAEADAHLKSVHDQIEGLKAAYRQKEQELALAQTNIAYAQKEFDRVSALTSSKAVSRSTFDSAAHDLEVARHNAEVTRQEIAQTLTQLAGNPDVAVEDHPMYLEARAARDKAELDLERTVVRAPFDGVASNVPDPGQQVIESTNFANPVMSVVADGHVWIDANFKETDLTHVAPGQAVTISIDTYPGHEWRGKVQSISPATGAEFSVIPAQNATGNWVKVVQRIPVRIAVDTQAGDPPLRAGMSAIVDIDTGHQREMPRFLSVALADIGVLPAEAAGPRQ